MCINNFIYDIRALKYRCVQSYFHLQLEEAQKLAEEGKGDVCVRDEDFIRSQIKEIKLRIEQNHNTYEDILKIVKTNPLIIPYYNVIGQIVKKHFSVGVRWIPSFLTIEVLRLFSEKGYQDFKDIDFLQLMKEYELFEDKKKSNLITHFKCAAEIVESISNKKVFKKKRKKK